MNALLTYENEEWEAGRITEHHLPISPHILDIHFSISRTWKRAPLNYRTQHITFSGAMCQGKRFKLELHLDNTWTWTHRWSN